ELAAPVAVGVLERAKALGGGVNRSGDPPLIGNLVEDWKFLNGHNLASPMSRAGIGRYFKLP
ncbi:MAG TPA: hypothetical protein VI391_02790, partial [Thermoanaerobaculia bacterium]